MELNQTISINQLTLFTITFTHAVHYVLGQKYNTKKCTIIPLSICYELMLIRYDFPGMSTHCCTMRAGSGCTYKNHGYLIDNLPANF